MAALLPLAWTIAIFLILRRTRRADWREDAMLCGLALGVQIVAITELLSLFYALGYWPLAAAWALSLAALGGALFAKRLRTVPRTQAGPGSERFSPTDFALLAGIAAVFAITGVLAWCAPPNTFDSMIYHMSRVMHWMQDRSVAFYRTPSQRQLYLGPFAEYAILQTWIFRGNDRLANFAQWAAMIGAVAGVSLLARELGARRRGQVLAAALCASIPMGILQSTSTQNDYVVAFCLVGVFYFALRLSAGGGALEALALGAALGLAALTKATAYVYALPFLAWIGLRAAFARDLRKIGWLGAAMGVVLALNAAQYWRDFERYGSPLGPAGEGPVFVFANDRMSPAVTLSNVVRNVAIHFDSLVPAWNRKVEAVVAAVHDDLGISVDDAGTTWATTHFALPDVKQNVGAEPPWLRRLFLFPTSEDLSGSPVHLCLILLSLAIYAFQRRGVATPYAVALVCAFTLFCAYLRWQPWHVRLHLPLLVLWTPFIGLVLSRLRPPALAIALVVPALLLSLPYLAQNQRKPLIGGDSVFAWSRDAQYFRGRPPYAAPYTGASLRIYEGNCPNVGLALRGNDWEYPIWVQMRERFGGVPVRLEHLNPDGVPPRTVFGDPASGDWIPCAVLSSIPDAPDTIAVGAVTFQEVWSSVPLSIYEPAPAHGP